MAILVEARTWRLEALWWWAHVHLVNTGAWIGCRGDISSASCGSTSYALFCSLSLSVETAVGFASWRMESYLIVAAECWICGS